MNKCGTQEGGFFLDPSKVDRIFGNCINIGSDGLAIGIVVEGRVFGVLESPFPCCYIGWILLVSVLSVC